MDCLDEEMAATLIEGRLPADEAALVEAHVDGCGRCRRLLANLAVALDSVESAASERPLRTESLPAGSTVARYRILEPLGAGAMGVVYRAVDPDLGREVALKLVRLSATAGEQADARLLREARALARLSHPNVVPVFDVGTYGGAVFFAMELLGGGTLGAWTRAEPREWRDVLARYVAAGRGLHAAHEAGLVHRDFKPDNVLLAAGDRVCVTDFGLVRATVASAASAALGALGEDDDAPAPAALATDTAEDDAVHRPLLTADGALLGTPAFMAPEQLAGQAATARSDQFSFCVALYEALYGELPFPGKTLPELRAALATDLVAASTETPSATASTRSVPPRLRPLLLRGLRIEPSERFTSVAELADALERIAQPPEETGRRSHARRWWLAGLAAAALVAGGTLLARRHTATEAVESCATAGASFETIWSAATRATMVQAFQASGALRAGPVASEVATKLDAYAAEWEQAVQSSCQATHVQHTQDGQTFALRQACLDRQAEELRPVVDTLVHADATLVPSASELMASLPTVAVCADVSTAPARMKPPEASIAAAVTRIRLQLAQARALTLVDRGQAALAIAQPAATEARALAYAPLVAEALVTLGRAQTRASFDPRGVQTLLEGVDVAEASRNDAAAATGWTTLIRAHLMMAGDGVSAARALPRARAAVQRLDGDSAAEESLRDNEAFFELSTGHFARARALYDQHLASLQTRFGADDLLLASPLDDRARALRYTDDYARAEADDERQHAIVSSYLGAESTRAAHADTQWGTDLVLLGRYVEAEQVLGRARAVYARTFGPEHTYGVFDLLALGDLYDRTSRLDEGLETTRHGAAIEEKTFGKEHPAIAFSQSALADAYLRRARYADALTAATRSATLWAALGETGSFERERARATMGLAQLGLQKLAEAKTTLTEVVAYFDAHEGMKPVRAAAAFALARLLATEKNVGDARPLAEKALADFRSLPAREAEVANVSAWLGELH